MSKLPKHVTFIVGLQGGVERSLCVEASSPSRLASFKRRSSELRTVRQPLGLDHDGKAMGASRLRVLRRQLYRHLDKKSLEQTRIQEEVFELLQVVCGLHKIAMCELLNPRTRKSSIKMARRHAARELRRQLHLSEKEIAKALKLKNTRYVVTWLKAEQQQRPRASRGSNTCQLLPGTTLQNSSQVTSLSFG